MTSGAKPGVLSVLIASKRDTRAASLFRWARLAVVVLPLLLYAGSLRVDFLMDDETIITANTRLSAGQGPAEIFTRPEQFADFTLPYYRPLVNRSYWVDARLWAMEPIGFHLTNWLLHAIVTLLVFELARALLPGLTWPLVAAALFAAHPIHTESVIMVQGRTDLLATGLLLLSVLALVRAVGAGAPLAAWVTGGVSVVALGGAILCKEPSVVWPALVGLTLAGLHTGRPEVRRWLPCLFAGLAVLVAYFWLRHAILGAVLPIDLHSLKTSRAGLVPISFVTYAWLLLWPFSFSFIRPVPAPEAWLDPRLLLAGLVGVGLLSALVFLGRRDRLVAVGGGWVVVSLLPFLNLFPIPGFVVAERYLYLPSVGFCILVAAIARWVIVRQPALRLPLTAAGLVVLVAFTATIQMRAIQWRDPVAVFEAMAQRAPGSFFVQNNLGLEYLKAGQPQDAVTALLRARELEPANPIAWNNLGVALRKSGRLSEARTALERALALDPRYGQASENLAGVLLDMGDRIGSRHVEEAARALRLQRHD